MLLFCRAAPCFVRLSAVLYMLLMGVFSSSAGEDEFEPNRGLLFRVVCSLNPNSIATFVLFGKKRKQWISSNFLTLLFV